MSVEDIHNAIQVQLEHVSKGYMKLGFEGGRLVTANIYNSPSDDEKKLPQTESDFDLRKVLEEVTDENFFGTLGFVFSSKKITNYYKSQTWKGTTLKLFLRG